MGALRLTYKENYRPLKVVRGNFYLQKNSDAERYEFGFNGQLKDNEIYGEGNAYTAEFWEYDPRSVRRWNRDFLETDIPDWTPYVAFGNNPILYKDPKGLAFWDPSNVRQAKKFAKATGGTLDIWRDPDNKKKYASVSFNSFNKDRLYWDVNTHTPYLKNEWVATTYVFRPGEDRSQLLLDHGTPFYEAVAASSSGWDSFVWSWKGIDNDFNRREQAPGVVKALAGLNPLVSTTNATYVLFKDKDIYGMEANTKLDKTLAVVSLIFTTRTILNLGATTSIKPSFLDKAGDVNDAVQMGNDAGLFDELKQKEPTDNNSK